LLPVDSTLIAAGCVRSLPPIESNAGQRRGKQGRILDAAEPRPPRPPSGRVNQHAGVRPGAKRPITGRDPGAEPRAGIAAQTF